MSAPPPGQAPGFPPGHPHAPALAGTSQMLAGPPGAQGTPAAGGPMPGTWPAQPGVPGHPAGQMAPDLRTGGARFAQFLQISLKRAFRVRIDYAEVLPEERAALAGLAPETQAFLAWRRSLLFVVAVFFVPVLLLQAIGAFGAEDGTPDALVGLELLQFLVNLSFAIALWLLLRQWMRWRVQRRRLAIAWAVYFLTPFLVFLYPLRSAVDVPGQQVALGLVFSVFAIMALAPKAVSVLPGLLRACVVSKHLLPGAAAPGWVMVLTAPIYALLLYVVLVMPYQMSGSGWFILSIGGFVSAQVWLGRTGYRLARPMQQAETLAAVTRARAGYIALNAAGLLCLVGGLWSLIGQLSALLSELSIFSMLLSLLVNVLLLTLISTDIMLAALGRAHGLSGGADAQAAFADYAGQLARLTAAPEHLAAQPGAQPGAQPPGAGLPPGPHGGPYTAAGAPPGAGVPPA